MKNNEKNIALAKNNFKKYAKNSWFFIQKEVISFSPTRKSWQQWHGRGAQWRWT
jgi:hypothetical protein